METQESQHQTPRGKTLNFIVKIKGRIGIKVGTLVQMFQSGYFFIGR